MATYKRRGNKVRKKEVVEQVEEFDVENSQTAEVFNTLDESANKTEEWVIKNQRSIFGVLGLIVVGILAFLAYQNFILGPKEKQAADNLAFPKKYFEKAMTGTVAVDSLLNLGLNGGDGKYGFIDIADKFSGTKGGNLANYYAGISYLKLKDYTKAIDYLDSFDADDLALAPTAKGAIGDAFSDINQQDQALNYYEKAANLRDNNFTTPLYLFKAGTTALDLGKYSKALSLFTKIKDKYPTSAEATDIDMYISRAKYAQ